MGDQMRIIAAVIIMVLLASSGYCVTSDKYFKETIGHPEDKSYMTGNWGGTRDDLADKGVTFASSFTCDILGNPTGGNEQGARYDSSLGWDVNWDLEKFAGLVGLQFHISALWRAGQNLSAATIGNKLVTSSIYGHEQFRFYSLHLQQTLFDGAFDLKIGRIGAGDDFAMSPLYWTFVSNGIDGNPITIPINLFFSCYPTATWGARLKLRFAEEFYSQTAIYNGDDGVQRDSMYGLDFSLRLKKGVFLAQELSYVPNTAPDAKGLPGHYKAGFYYDSGVYRDLYGDLNGASYAVTGLPQKKRVGNCGVYLHADQMVYREQGPGTEQGLVPLISVALAPSYINQLPFFFMSGLIYKGLVPGRDYDVTACQFMYAAWSGDIKHAEQDAGITDTHKYEIILELTHKILITKWMYLQPDMQYIINPGGTGTIKDAFVVGTRFGLNF